MDEEYYSRWSKLFYFIDRAYKDVQILHTLDMQNDAIRKGEASIIGIDKVLSHIALVAGEDLALCLCKIFYDKKSQNNLSRLNAFLQTNYPAYAIPTNEFQALKQDKKFVTDLTRIRDKWLAHNDVIDASVSMDFNCLWKALGNVTSVFNKMCKKEIDQRVYPYNETTIVKTFFDISVQMSRLLS
jgi:hypothetical protein